MSIVVSNPFGMDPAEFDENTSAERIGRRIRKVRELKGMSQADLGELIGLNADRVQKYENGARRPKPDMLGKIAGALGVRTSALTDPNTTTQIGAFYALFEMEELYDLRLKEDGAICLQFGDGRSGSINEYLRRWCEEKEKYESGIEMAAKAEAEELKRDYCLWKWNFPKALVDETRKERQKTRLQNKIQELEAELKKLEEE